MHARARMFILAAEPTIARLRREAPCRALSEPGAVVALPLERIASAAGMENAATDVPEEARLLFEAASARGIRPAVAICEVLREGDVARFVASLRSTARVLGSRLQRDRMPFPLNAIIVVGVAQLGTSDQAALQTLCEPADCENRGPIDGASPPPPDTPLSELVPAAIPVYLMLGRTRLDHDSRSWDCAEVWPTAVARLLASLEAEPRRTGGLRAWRSAAALFGSSDAAGLEREALTIVRWAVSAKSHLLGASSPPEAGGIRDELAPETPPSDAVDASAAPRHRLDLPGRSRGSHPEVPAFWELAPCLDDPANATGGAARHTNERLDSSRESDWQARRSERGGAFVRDRARRAVASVYTFAGPRSILRRVWQRIHAHPKHLEWHAEGGFIDLGDRRELRLVTDQLLEWRKIEELDEAVEQTRAVAAEQAIELDRARARFVGVAWRLAAIGTAALFAAAIVGTALSSFDSKWVLYTGAGTAVAAMAAGAAVLAGELLAARRGRRLLEDSNAAAEAAVSRAFAARLTLGSQGELLQRSMAWLQSAARVRETARRLLELQRIALERSMAAGPTFEHGDLRPVHAFARSSSAATRMGIAGENLAQTLWREDPEFLIELQRDFQAWWSDALRTRDPGEVGSVAAHAFRPELEAALGEMRIKARMRLMRFVEDRPTLGWLDEVDEQLRRVLGIGTEFPALSVQSVRACGLPLRRTTLALANCEPMLHRLASSTERSTLEGASVVRRNVELEAWGLAGLVVDEIAVTVARTHAQAPIHLVEGVHRSEDETSASESREERRR